MKAKAVLLLLNLCFVSLYSQERYRGISFEIPEGWMAVPIDFPDIGGYQLGAFGEDIADMFFVRCMAPEFEPVDVLEFYIASLEERWVEKMDFQSLGIEELETEQGRVYWLTQFSCMVDGVAREGFCAALRNCQTDSVYMILMLGSDSFWTSDAPVAMMGSIDVASSSEEAEELAQNKIARTKVLQDKWCGYTVDGSCYFEIPPTLELRDEGAFINLLGKLTYRYVSSETGLDGSNYKIVFQPVGLNDLEKTYDKELPYARILIARSAGKMDDYFSCSLYDELSKLERRLLEEYLDEGLKETAEADCSRLDGKMGSGRILSWTPCSIKKTKSGLSYLAYGYIRQLDGNKPVKVMNYWFSNLDESIAFVMSHRVSEPNWEAEFERVLESVEFVSRNY